ncbi:protein seele-like [Bradysia coprophila]|uniref:protein seele-like n=1 Tax=Bradysia coprophila TaxID=38358 RepID=UPI00187DB38F|nr:protein seele-like [Bradysia coprophila]XP_037033742.1 protein seele-like [Bradysia coprophila]
MNWSAICHLCILMSLLLVVRCNDDDDDYGAEDGDADDGYVDHGDFDSPTKEYATDPKILSRNVKCLVCEATILEMKNAIKKVDPRKKVEVSGFRMDSDGFSEVKSVQYSRSETYLTELMDTICKKMDDYAKARDKVTRKLLVLKMVTDDGKMNPLMGSVDFVQDGDLNKSLEHFCLEILEDHEEAILKEFMKEVQADNIDHIVCTKTAKYCDEDDADEDDYNRDEL